MALWKPSYNSLIQFSTSECQLISGSVKNNKTPENIFLYKNNSQLQHVTWNDSLEKEVLKFFPLSTLIQAWHTSPWGGTWEPAHSGQHLGLEFCSSLVLVFLLPLPPKFWLLYGKAYQLWGALQTLLLPCVAHMHHWSSAHVREFEGQPPGRISGPSRTDSGNVTLIFITWKVFSVPGGQGQGVNIKGSYTQWGFPWQSLRVQDNMNSIQQFTWNAFFLPCALWK